jgi:RHS repeat-associated protein
MRITNGFGAKTELVYQPLSLKSVYLRDSNSRNSLNWGRGSPVQDLLAPMYVVAMARSSAPTYNNAAAMSSLYYRYAGAKIQAGGRGYLGFREITTFDVNYGGKYVASTTQYAQNFPFIGSPVSTSRRVVSGTYTPDACYTTVTDSCYTTPGTAFPAIGGTQVAASVQSWEVSPAFNPGLQEILHARTQGTQDEQFDLGTGVRTSRVNTAMSYGAFGNVSLTAVDTYTGTDNTNAASISTNNTYVNDEANWRLGRMTVSTVTHTRAGASITRTTAYDYDMGGPVTGFLKAERIQPNGNVREDLRTEYQLDEYGNRIGSYTCSANVAPCIQTTGLALNPWYSYEQVQRYSRVTYDADGRYPLTTHEPFRALGSTWDSGQITEYITQTVLARDEFGEPTQVQDVNGRVAASMNGAMGRDYWSWAPTASTQAVGATSYGIHSFKTYRFCGVGTDQVPCPSGAVFREQVSATGSASKWTYFDVLGRPLLVAAQSFNENQTGKDFAATCQWYDSTGKTYGSSTPFFLSDAAANGAPQFSSNPCALTSRNIAYSLYDVLGRPTQVILADGSSTSLAYNGLSTVTTNAKGQTKTELKNGSGELVQATDQSGFSTYYYYNAAGNLTVVERNAGRGVVSTTMAYDALGRKISMNDPDAGIRYYAYNAAGEQDYETDGTNKVLYKRYDRRGRVVWEGNVDWTPEPDFWEKQTFYHFDQAANGVGQMQSNASSGTNRNWVGIAGRNTEQSNAAGYDNMGRVTNTTNQIDGVSYNSYVVYDSLGRGYKTQDPSGKWTKTEFTPRGFAIRVCATDANDTAPGCIAGSANTYLETLDVNARGQVLTDRKGASVDMYTVRHYDDLTGRNTRICEGSAGCQVVNETYAWDTVGNLTYQDKGGYREDFVYDGMNRLTEGRLTRVGTTTYAGNVAPISVYNTYDRLGNVCSKMIDNTLQSYSYAGRAGCGLNGSLGNVNGDLSSSPHQAQSANGYTYAYDTHGNQTIASHGTMSKSRSVIYSLDDRAYEMTKGSDVTRFWYGVGGDRYKRQDISAAGTKTTINVANLEIETLNGVVTTKRTVAGVLLEETKGTAVTNKYLHYDQLGNVVRITNANGVVLEKLDFDAFGARRNVIDPRQTFISAGNVSNGTVTLPGNQILTLYATKRGFTGHEMVDGFDIVHMNGRIYDNMIGRFLQADPVVQDPSNTQNFNRYTYVWNNPLAYTDPSGYMSFRQVLSIAVLFIPIPGVGPLVSAMIQGFLSGVIGTGTLRGGIQGAFSAALFFGVGKLSTSLGMAEASVGRALMHGMAGGVLSVMQGGKFGHGFVSAGLSKAVMARIDTGTMIADGMLAALAGGAISKLTGGKFANGAATAAMQFAFNQAMGKSYKTKNASIKGDTDGKVTLKLRDVLRTTLTRDGATGTVSLPGNSFSLTANTDGDILINGEIPAGPGQIKFSAELVDGLRSIGYDIKGGGIELSNFTQDGFKWKISYKSDSVFGRKLPFGIDYSWSDNGDIKFNARDFVDRTFAPKGYSSFREAIVNGDCRWAGDCP